MKSKAGNKASSSQKPAKSGSKKSKMQSIAAAMYKDSCPRIGLSDLRSHKLSWVAGYVYVGDGINGAQDSVYFRIANNSAGVMGTKIVPGTSGGGQVPVLGSDTRIGQSYVRDIAQHFSRKRINSCTLKILPLAPSTANSCQVVVAPVRGYGQSGDTRVFWGATTAAPLVTNTMGMAGAKSAASWQEIDLDLTPYIAGGSGPKQNEFNINADAEFSDSTWGDLDFDLTEIAPCAFVITGTNNTTALRGTNVSLVLIEQNVDFLDFLAGNSALKPESLIVTKMTEEEAKVVFGMLMGSSVKGVRDFALTKALIKRLGASQ